MQRQCAPVKLSTPESRAGSRERRFAILLFLAALLVAGALRLPYLEARPMHTDETTQAIKLRDLTNGKYTYDPLEHHGPTLLYAAELRNWLRERKAFADLTEADLRLVPVWFSLWLVALLPLLRGGLGWLGVGWAAVFLAVSPSMVFYSRYFIMEMLLVCFSFTTILGAWRFYLTRTPVWLWLCGISVGLMHATKETFVIHLAGMLGGVLLVSGMRHLSGGQRVLNRHKLEPITARHWLTFLALAVVTSAACFSQGFTHPSSILDSVQTYFSYAQRAGGQGHQKPFLYYCQLLGWNHGGKFWLGESSGRFLWTELLILSFAVLGMVRSLGGQGKGYRRELGLFLTAYAGLTFLAYSCIAYKTPWCILSTHLALILLAGFGVSGFLSMLYADWGKGVFCAIMLVGAGHLAFQSYRANFPDDPSTQPWLRTLNAHSLTDNPYAYGFTPLGLRDTIVPYLEGYAARSPAGHELRMDIATPSGSWPLPWYLRKFPNVAYRPDLTGLDPTAAAILVDPALVPRLPLAIRGADEKGSATYAKHIYGMLNQQYWIQGYVQRSLVAPHSVSPPPQTPTLDPTFTPPLDPNLPLDPTLDPPPKSEPTPAEPPSSPKLELLPLPELPTPGRLHLP